MLKSDSCMTMKYEKLLKLKLKGNATATLPDPTIEMTLEVKHQFVLILCDSEIQKMIKNLVEHIRLPLRINASSTFICSCVIYVFLLRSI